MKTLTAALVALVLVCPSVRAASSDNTDFSLAMNTDPAIAPSTFLTVSADSVEAVSASPMGTSHFAQFVTPAKSLPVSPKVAFALAALFIVALRLMAVRQAHAMAENERQSNRRRAQMFRALHEQRASRR